MGKGIAVAFKEKYPKMYLEYKRRCKSWEFAPGNIYVYQYGQGYVFNLGTQVSWTTGATLMRLSSLLRRCWHTLLHMGYDRSPYRGLERG